MGFALRILDLGERRKVSARHTGSKVRYPQKLVEEMFHQTLTTCLKEVEFRIGIQEV
jgi:hypothetical protein